MSFVEKVCRALTDRGVRYALVGGYAVSFHGAVRGTVDIDVVVDWNLETLQGAEQALRDLGLVSRLPVGAADLFNFRDEFVNNRNLIAWNFYHPDDISQQVDVVITYDLRGRRRHRVTTTSGPLFLLTLEDLVNMKKASGRPQDLADVEALEKLP
jgi:hypothetical protein